MILTDEQAEPLISAWKPGDVVDHDLAQTLASWWYGPGATGLIVLCQRGRWHPELPSDVQWELDILRADMEQHRPELLILAAWAEQNGEPLAANAGSAD